MMIPLPNENCLLIHISSLAKEFKHLYEGRNVGTTVAAPENRFALPELPADWSTENFWPRNSAWDKVAEVEAARQRHRGIVACACGYRAVDAAPQIDATMIPYGLVDPDLERRRKRAEAAEQAAKGTSLKRGAEEENIDAARRSKRAKGGRNAKNLEVDTQADVEKDADEGLV